MENFKKCCLCGKDFKLESELPYLKIGKKILCPDCCQDAAIKFEDFLELDPNMQPVVPEEHLMAARNIIISITKIADNELSTKPDSSTQNSARFNRRLIFNEVTKCVKGQDKQIKKLISVIIENQLITSKEYKDNILIVGSTGVGKTYSVENVLKELGICYCIVDANSYSEVGYIGNDISDCIQSLANASNGDLSKAERGVVVIDEFDKLRQCFGEGRDVSGSSVQEELLTLMSGKKEYVNINNKRHVEFDTSFVTFILMGAFDDTNPDTSLDGIRKNRLGNSKRIGFFTGNETIEKSNDFSPYLSEDFSSYGIISQIVGRTPVILEYNDISEEIALDILLNSSSSKFNYFLKRFSRYEVEIQLADNILLDICKMTIKDKTGARGLNRFLEILFSEALEKIEEDYEDEIYYSKCTFFEDSLKNNSHFLLESYKANTSATK